jgi:hypothetical protein
MTGAVYRLLVRLPEHPRPETMIFLRKSPVLLLSVLHEALPSRSSTKSLQKLVGSDVLTIPFSVINKRGFRLMIMIARAAT